MHRNGDVDLLLDAFCLYQEGLNPTNDADPKHWDHALLFTGSVTVISLLHQFIIHEIHLGMIFIEVQ